MLCKPVSIAVLPLLLLLLKIARLDALLKGGMTTEAGAVALREWERLADEMFTRDGESADAPRGDRAAGEDMGDTGACAGELGTLA